LPAEVASNVENATDILVLRRANLTGIQLAAEMASNQADVDLVDQASYPFSVNDVTIISDCLQATLFKITGLTSSGVVSHAIGSGFGNLSDALTTDGSVFGADAELYPIESHIFYIADSAATNQQGDTPLSLWRKIGDDSATELLSGVSDLQLLYGEDTDADGVPNRYVQAKDADMDNVITVQFTLTVNSIDPENSGSLIQKDFSNTVKLRNRGA